MGHVQSCFLLVAPEAPSEAPPPAKMEEQQVGVPDNVIAALALPAAPSLSPAHELLPKRAIFLLSPPTSASSLRFVSSPFM